MKNLSIYQQLGNKRLDQLDGLRGICSLAVVLDHSLDIPYTYGPLIGQVRPELIGILQACGGLAVMVFFVLSGFVIGYTTPLKYTKEEAKNYILRRLIRLYPIYLFALFLTYLLSDKTYSIKNILAHIFFMQNWLVPIAIGNDSLWTLHYEFTFYLLFLLVWKFNLKTKTCILMCFYCAILSIFFAFHPIAILGYFTLWLGGYWLSHNIDYLNLVDHDYLSYRFWSPIVLTVISVIGFQELFIALMYKFGTPFPFPRPVFTDVIFSALTISIVASLITKKKVPFYLASLVLILVIRLGISLYSWQIAHGVNYHIYIDSSTSSGISLMILPIVLVLRKVPIVSLKNLSYLGSFSYALYLLHYPIIYWFNRLAALDNVKSNLPFSLLILTFVALFISILLSWFLECRLQPTINKKLKEYFSVY